VTLLVSLDHPLLDAERERDLLKRVALGNAASELLGQELPRRRRVLLAGLVSDRDRAIDELVSANLRLAARTARRYAGRDPARFEDLLQEASIGLLAAIEDFDASRGARFASYAVWRIQDAVAAGAARVPMEAVRLPRRALNQQLRTEQLSELLTQRLGRTPTSDELAQELGTSRQRAELLALPLRVVSLGASSEPSAPEEHAPERGVEDAELAEELRGRLEALFAACDEVERALLRARFGLGDERPRALVELVGLSPWVERAPDLAALLRLETELLSRLRSLVSRAGAA
jgi:RNA polymerase sigma factor (sigma-70 family)